MLSQSRQMWTKQAMTAHAHTHDNVQQALSLCLQRYKSIHCKF